MRKVIWILGVALIVLAAMASWEIGTSEVANIQLQDDMRDLAAQLGTRVGLARPSSDSDLCDSVIRKAREHDIILVPSQVRVQREGSGATATVSLAADYKVLINILGWTFTLHFTPTSRG